MALALKIRGKLKNTVSRISPFVSLLAEVLVALNVCTKTGNVEETLLLESAILSMRKPSKQSHEAFRNHFWNCDDPGGSFPTLLGSSCSLYDNRDDLVALVQRADEDPLTALLRKRAPRFFLVSCTCVSYHYLLLNQKTIGPRHLGYSYSVVVLTYKKDKPPIPAPQRHLLLHPLHSLHLRPSHLHRRQHRQHPPRRRLSLRRHSQPLLRQQRYHPPRSHSRLHGSIFPLRRAPHQCPSRRDL